MNPARFDYRRAGSADEAIGWLTEAGDDAKLLAGGHSLLPLMKMRLARPNLIIDIGRLADLSYIRVDGDQVAIGALTRHHEVEISEVLAREVPLLAAATAQVGDPQIRHRGTIGGSLAHGDPASDLPAVVLALGGTLVARGPSGERSIPAAEFFLGFMETALAPNEVLTEIRVPRMEGAGWSFQKFNRRALDWAIVGVAAQKTGTNGNAGVALVNMASTPVRASAVEAALADGASAAEAAAHAADGLNPPTDTNAGPEFRRHLAQVLVRRALEEAGA